MDAGIILAAGWIVVAFACLVNRIDAWRFRRPKPRSHRMAVGE